MVRAAIVGLGRWGRILVESVHGKTGDIAFVLAQTRSRAKAEDFCRDKNIALVDDFSAVLSDKTIDAVVLATPHSQHKEQIERAARAGKHIFVEKPFTLTRRDAVAALDAVTKAGVVLAVGFNRRFHPNIVELKTRLDGGRLGEIGSCVGEHTAFAGMFTPRETWRADPRESPAGAMTALGIHTVDTMIHLLGRIREVHCINARRAAPHIDDTTSVMLKFANGASGLFFASLATAANYRIAVYGSKGFAEILGGSLDDFRFVPAPDSPSANWTVAPAPEVIHRPGFDLLRAELTAFAAAIRKRAPYPVTPDEVLHGVEVFEAIVTSAESGKPVTIN